MRTRACIQFLEEQKQLTNMTNNKKGLFEKFFEDYSKNVDNASSQFFWRLSDEIILGIIGKHIKSNIPKEAVILDAGGGTGRWIQMLSKTYPSKFVLYDKSKDMLEVALRKRELQKLSNRLKVIQGDIQDMNTINDSGVDYLVSIYNPISFVKNPLLFFREVQRILKPNGVGLIMGQGLPNAIASKINNYLADAPELKNLDKNETVKWNSSLAPLHVFSKESFEALANNAKLKVAKIYGIPVFVQPGPEDFDSKNKLKSRISSKLESIPEFYQTVFRLEMKYNSQESFVNRGMNLMIIVQKQ